MEVEESSQKVKRHEHVSLGFWIVSKEGIEKEMLADLVVLLDGKATSSFLEVELLGDKYMISFRGSFSHSP